MKQKEIMLNSPHKKNTVMHEQMIEDIGNDHISSSTETPMNKDAFFLSEEKKIKKIALHFKEIMGNIRS